MFSRACLWHSSRKIDYIQTHMAAFIADDIPKIQVYDLAVSLASSVVRYMVFCIYILNTRFVNALEIVFWGYFESAFIGLWKSVI